MEERRVDLRIPNPERSKEGKRTTGILHRFNAADPLSVEYQELMKELFTGGFWEKSKVVGAGTVLNVEQVERAMNAGARFIVCPGFDSKVVDYCLERKIPVLPGCVTPSEIMQAIACGLKMVKFFPAVQFGGVAMIKALAAPYNEMKFVPTGGVNKENLKEFLSYKAVAACGGSWMVKREWIQNGEFDRIRSLVIEAAKLKGEIRSENRNEKRR